MSTDYFIEISPEGPLPAYYLVAEHLWGPGCNIDSDGDSKPPDDRHWTELTLTLRTTPGLRVDVDPVSINPLVLVVRSENEAVCVSTASYIISVAGGSIGPTVCKE